VKDRDENGREGGQSGRPGGSFRWEEMREPNAVKAAVASGVRGLRNGLREFEVVKTEG
jgi:hypothetical protein